MEINKDVYLRTPTNLKLYNLLKNICDYDEYIFGIMDYCETDEHQQKMIEVISGGVNNISEISLWAVSLYSGKDINKLKEKWL